MWPEKKTYPYVVATFPSRTECKRGNTENWLPIRRGGGGKQVHFIVTEPNPPNPPPPHPPIKKLTGPCQLTITEKSVRIIVTTGGTDGRIKCSDWPTKPPVMEALLFMASLGKIPAFEPKMTQKYNLLFSYIDYHFKVFYCMSDNALMETFCFVDCNEHYWLSNNCVKIYLKHY